MAHIVPVLWAAIALFSEASLKGSSWCSPKTVAKVGISHCPKKGGGDFAGQKLARNEDTAGILSIVDHDTQDSNVCQVFAWRLCPNFSETQKLRFNVPRCARFSPNTGTRP